MKRIHFVFPRTLPVLALLAAVASPLAHAGDPSLLLVCEANAHDSRIELQANERGWRQELGVKQRESDLFESAVPDVLLARVQADIPRVSHQLEGLPARRTQIIRELRDCRRDGGPSQEGFCLTQTETARARVQSDETDWREELDAKQRVLEAITSGNWPTVRAGLPAEIKTLNHHLEGATARREEITKELRDCRRDAGQLADLLEGAAPQLPTALNEKALPPEPDSGGSLPGPGPGPGSSGEALTAAGARSGPV